jgi:hypothetical protein
MVAAHFNTRRWENRNGISEASVLLSQSSNAAPHHLSIRPTRMGELRHIIERFPQRELDLRRSFARDGSFRAICSDYEEAAKACEHWRQAVKRGDPTGERKVEDYEELLVELEQEILSHLSDPKLER